MWATGTRTSASCRTAPMLRHSQRESSTDPDPPCLSENATEVANAETEISQQARAYAGDPTYTCVRWRPTGFPTVGGDEHGDRETGQRRGLAGLDELRGPNGSDGGGPCLARSVGDDVSDAGGANGNPQWIDVKVKEKGRVALRWNRARSCSEHRSELASSSRPARGISGFVPLGVPDDRIAKARARFINGCDGSQLGPLLTLKLLAPAYQNISGVTPGGRMTETTMQPPLPAGAASRCPRGLTGCPSGQDYVPITVEVRAAGRPDIDLDPPVTCATLAVKPQAGLLARHSDDPRLGDGRRSGRTALRRHGSRRRREARRLREEPPRACRTRTTRAWRRAPRAAPWMRAHTSTSTSATYSAARTRRTWTSRAPRTP